MTRYTLTDWRRDYDLLTWPAPWPIHSPGLIWQCLRDLVRAVIGG